MVARAAVAYLGVGQLGLQDEHYLRDYWAQTVQAVGARRVVLTHWDDFFRPLDQPLRALPFAGDDLNATLDVLGRLAAEQNVALHFPTVWRREDPWAGRLRPLAEEVDAALGEAGELGGDVVVPGDEPGVNGGQVTTERADPLRSLLSTSQSSGYVQPQGGPGTAFPARAKEWCADAFARCPILLRPDSLTLRISMKSTLAITATIALLLGLAAPPGNAAAPPTRDAKAKPESVIWVTLVTGDRIAVRAGLPARSSLPGVAARCRSAGDRARRLVRHPGRRRQAGEYRRARPQLFNVTGLVRQGHDDAAPPSYRCSSSTPTRRRARRPRRRRAPGPDLEQREPGGAAGEQEGRASLLGLGQAAAQGWPAGVRRLWLDRKVKASLDRACHRSARRRRGRPGSPARASRWRSSTPATTRPPGPRGPGGRREGLHPAGSVAEGTATARMWRRRARSLRSDQVPRGGA